MQNIDSVINLLADKTCNNCKYLGTDDFDIKSTYELPPGDYCAFEDLIKCPKEFTCENWKEKS